MNRFLSLFVSYFVFAICSSATAQIVPDGTLPSNSQVSDDLEITGGTVRGNNLFHSFSEFSVGTGETAFFNHNLTIENIISRVTGSSVSSIDGLIRSLGDADLFLINPNGIVFGENAALDVGGSFIGSTANSVVFADGSVFSAVAAQEPLLTVSIPIGLQYGNNAEAITVEGAGNNLSIDFFTFTVDRSDRPVGLSVTEGNTLALIGGDVSLSGGNLTAEEGRVVIGSVTDDSLVSLTRDSLGWNFDYDSLATFGVISLSEAASVEVSGSGGGEVFLQGNNIFIEDGSAILADTLGENRGKVLRLDATESIELIGSATDNFFPTRLSTDVDLDGTGDGGNLIIDTDYLLVADGAQVNSGTFGLGDGGNLTVTASEIEVIGESFDGEFASGLFAQADFGDTGNGGDLTITTDYLLVADGAQISTTTFGSGDGGNLSVTASEIEIVGAAREFASGLFVSTEDSGNGGNLEIVTDYLLLAGGGEITTTTFGSGDGGSVTVTASEIEIIGGAAEVGSSGLFANVEFTEIEAEAEDGSVFFEIIEATGNGGDILLKSDRLSISGGGRIEAFTNTLGDAGTITIESQEVNLVGTSRGGITSRIFAVSFSEGVGGDITLTTANLNITGGAQIATSTTGSGKGGNLTVSASNSINISGSSAFGSSGLFANAIAGDGSGGNVFVNTEFLSLTDGATISVSNFPSSDDSPFPPGEGAAGSIFIVASEIALDEATITADTFSGDRGNLNFQTDLLLLRNGSTISTNAQSTATGGNINIDASGGFLVAVPQENSDITANAVFGDGGQVNITALEILGIEPRDSLTLKSDITASSEFGLAGTVVLNVQDLDPTNETEELSNTFQAPKLAQGCEGQSISNSFINTGKGGLSPQPDDALRGDELIGDVQVPRQWQDDSEIVEAQGWIMNEKGNIALVADIPNQSVSLRCQDTK